MGKLDETSNLLALYAHHVGRSNVPQEFHMWACLTGISACVTDRVALDVIPDKPLAPNIYVMLLGPSGAGKGMAIDKIVDYIEHLPSVARLVGKVSGMGIVDYLSEQSAKKAKATDPTQPDGTKPFVAMAELSFSIGEGSVADQFLKTMTELYSPAGSQFYERTRMGGTHTFTKPCITWLAGTTMEWLMTSVKADHIMSGFFGRTCAVISQGVKQSMMAPELPPDYAVVKEHILKRLERLSRIEGKFTRTPAALEVERAWFYGLQATGNPALEPFEARQHALSLKLAMLLSLADDESLVIDHHHMAFAQTLVDKLRITLPRLIEFAFSIGDVKPVRVVEGIVQKAGEIPHYMLMNKARRLGIAKYQLDLALKALIEERTIVRATVEANTKVPKMVYRWARRDIFARILHDMPQEGDEEAEVEA